MTERYKNAVAATIAAYDQCLLSQRRLSDCNKEERAAFDEMVRTEAEMVKRIVIDPASGATEIESDIEQAIRQARQHTHTVGDNKRF